MLDGCHTATELSMRVRSFDVAFSHFRRHHSLHGGYRVLLKLFAVTTPDEHTILVLLRRLCYGKAISHFPDMSFCGVVSPDLLVTQLHGELKRVLAADTGVHFTGLHQAASYCWRNALLDGKTCKKLRALDIVNSYMKQISVIR